jgi:predicted NBD/HSP70 family sugar kinase
MADDRDRRTDARVLAVLATSGALSRTDLAALCGLPRSTVGDAVVRLAAAGRVHERRGAPAGEVRRGRPPSRVALAGGDRLVGVLQLTNGATRAAVLGTDGAVLGRSGSAEPFPVDLVGRATALLAEAAAAAGRDLGALSCAVACVPLPVPEDGVPVPPAWRRASSQRPGGEPVPALPDWAGTDVAAALSARLGVPVWAENDANLAALGELESGAGRGLRDVVYLKLVTGVGTGLVLDGVLRRGAGGLAGELAHLSVRDDGPVCVCGGRGCLRTLYSSPMLVDLVQPAHDRALTLDDVLALGEQGDPGVCRVLADLGDVLGRALADLCVHLALDGAVVVDGVLGGAAGPVVDGVRRGLDRYAQRSVASAVQVLVGRLGADAELVGAVRLTRERALRPAQGR